MIGASRFNFFAQQPSGGGGVPTVVDSVSGASAGTGAGDFTLTITVTAPNQKLIAFASCEGSTNASTPAYNAPVFDSGGADEATFTTIDATNGDALVGGGTDPEMRLQAWYLDNPAVGTYSVTFDITGVVVGNQGALVLVDGAHSGAPSVTGKDENTTGLGTSITFDVPDNNSLVIDGFAHKTAGGTIDPDNGQTSLEEYRWNSFGNQHWLGIGALEVVTAGSTTVGWSHSVTNDKNVGIALALAPT